MQVLRVGTATKRSRPVLPYTIVSKQRRQFVIGPSKRIVACFSGQKAFDDAIMFAAAAVLGYAAGRRSRKQRKGT